MTIKKHKILKISIKYRQIMTLLDDFTEYSSINHYLIIKKNLLFNKIK